MNCGFFSHSPAFAHATQSFPERFSHAARLTTGPLGVGAPSKCYGHVLFGQLARAQRRRFEIVAARENCACHIGKARRLRVEVLRCQLAQQRAPHLGLPQMHRRRAAQQASRRSVELGHPPRVPRRPVKRAVVEHVHGGGHLKRELERETHREAVPHVVGEVGVSTVPAAHECRIWTCEH
eukprot:6187109-Pleurochrysis_carterae.AAC.4